MESLVKRLTDKSVEAFIMGIEIYNKPTIKYRVEGFSFFICNSWELMLKAHIINEHGENKIYYSDKPDRTISLEDSVKTVFTNNKDPLRLNLERIIRLRNTSTHFITEDYERIYAPLFQANVINYIEKMQEFHSIDITKYIALNFLTLNIRMDDLSDQHIKAKYSKAMAERIIKDRNEIDNEISLENNSFAIPVETSLLITKNENDADLRVKVDKSADASIRIVKEQKDINSIYIYTTRNVITLVNKRLKKQGIFLRKLKDGDYISGIFTSSDFQLFVKFYGLKTDEKYAYKFNIGDRYGYSIKIIDFLVEEIKKDPENIIQNLKKEIKK